ncbi:MAG TPA: MarP family serine protease [Solirubrobacteraceae bacterium]|nr:MarP family serine protease [Solirubrobacteraceae bacterium]
MTAIDIVIIVVAVFFGFVGYARGFLIGVLSFLGFAGGAYLGTRFGPHLLKDGNDSPFAPLFGLLGALFGGVILSALTERAGGSLRSGIRSPAFAAFDGLAGAALAVVLAVGLAWLTSVIVLQTPGVRDFRGPIQRSAILKELNTILPSDTVLKALARFDPLPSIQGPAVDVGPPRASVVHDPDIKRAGLSVMRILSNSCGLGVAGSGWVAAPGIVVTNAHVVAGSSDTTVSPQGSDDRLEATVIHFDPNQDVAILHVPSLTLAPLRFSRDVKPTEPGAVLGYPLDGPFKTLPARVGNTASLLAHDAYGRHLVRREVTSFRAGVKPGNSGGPIVDVAGRVSGTVFSKLVDGPGGYAVPNDTVRKALHAASGDVTHAVSTGPCVG